MRSKLNSAFVRTTTPRPSRRGARGGAGRRPGRFLVVRPGCLPHPASPSFYPYNINWNYGMLPQTWEDPAHKNADLDGVAVRRPALMMMMMMMILLPMAPLILPPLL